MTYPQQQYQPQQPMYPGNNGTPQQPYQPTTGTAFGQQQSQGASLPAVPPPAPTLAQGGGGGAWPKMRNMVDRLIIVEPIRVDETATDKAGKLRPEAYFHLTVVNGGPLRYGDSEDDEKPRPHTHEIDTPARWTNANSYSYGFVQAVRDALAAGEPARVGVVQRGTMGNKPYLITKPSTDVHGNARPNGDALFAKAMAVWTKIWNAKHGGEPFVSPTPRSLVAAPAQPTPQVSYQQTAPTQGATYGTAGGAPQYAYPQPTQYAEYVPAGASMQVPTPGTAGGAQQQPYAQAGQAYGQYAAPQAAPGYDPYTIAGVFGQQPMSAPPAPQQQPPAAEFAPPIEAWINSLPESQREGARQQMRAQQQPAGPAGPGF